MAFVLGLTGNIGCGKTTVGTILTRDYDVDYVDADLVVHRLYEPGTPQTLAIAQRFGADLLTPAGTIDRRRLGDIVMKDPEGRRDLEEMLQPGIKELLGTRLEQPLKPVLVLDAIRLIEAGWHTRCQVLWVIACPREKQEERLMRTRGLTREQAVLRIEGQTPQEAKIPYADVVIQNTGSQAELEQQIHAAWDSSVAPHLLCQKD